tara:strand:- start:444 stop:728 length:285 start_codon:yes stop_codon:yes gene_type:complete
VGPLNQTGKYKEQVIIDKLTEYIHSTYSEHYANDDAHWGKDIQAIDIFRALDIDKDFCHANALKYLLRYGKKNGHNEQDLYKAIHYIILLISNK